MRSEVYSWRLSPGLKTDLERVARVRKIRVSTVLDMAVREWLAKNAQEIAGDEGAEETPCCRRAIYRRYCWKKSSPRRKLLAATIRKSLRRRYGR